MDGHIWMVLFFLFHLSAISLLQIMELDIVTTKWRAQMEGLHIVLQTKKATHRAVWKRQLYDPCRISGSSLIGRQNKSKVLSGLVYIAWSISLLLLYLLQAIDEDKMNDVEFLLKNGEDAMSKSLAEGKNHGTWQRRRKANYFWIRIK